MNALPALALGLAVAAMPAAADSHVFRAIVGDAANIESDAGALAQHLRDKRFDAAKVAEDIERLGGDIAKLRKDVETFEANASTLTPAQQSDWQLIKTKVELLTIFHDRKTDLMKGDVEKNRTLLRAHAKGIAERARKLQQTASRLDR